MDTMTRLDTLFEKQQSEKGITWEEMTARTKALCSAIIVAAKEKGNNKLNCNEDVLSRCIHSTPTENRECAALLSSVKSFIVNSTQMELEQLYQLIRQGYQNYTYDLVYKMRLAPANYYYAASAEFAPWSRIEPTAGILLECIFDYTNTEKMLSQLERIHATVSAGILAKNKVNSYTSLQKALHEDFWTRFDSDDLSSYHPGPANFIFNMGRALYFSYVCYKIAYELVEREYLVSSELPTKVPMTPPSQGCPWDYDCANCGAGGCH